MMELPNLDERIRQLMSYAAEKLGPERAEQLRPDIQQMAQELEMLQSFELSVDDEP